MKIVLKYIGYLLLLAGIGLVIYGCTLPDSTTMVCLGILTVCAGWLIAGTVLRNEKKYLAEEMGKWLYYDPKENTLYIYKRGKKLLGTVYAEALKNYTSHVTPTKVHVGAATVGGVTTGGTYTTGGQRVIDDTYESGKGYIIYTNALFNPNGQLIKEKVKCIKLNPELLKQFNANVPIGEDGTIVVYKDSPQMDLSELQYAMNNLHSTVTQDMAQRGYRSMDQCKKIVEWLTSDA